MHPSSQIIVGIIKDGCYHYPWLHSVNNNMRSHGQHSQCGHDGEGWEEEEAESIEHHCGKLPVSFHRSWHFVISDLVSNYSNLLHRQLVKNSHIKGPLIDTVLGDLILNLYSWQLYGISIIGWQLLWFW